MPVDQCAMAEEGGGGRREGNRGREGRRPEGKDEGQEETESGKRI